jgi:hypothetical protein
MQGSAQPNPHDSPSNLARRPASPRTDLPLPPSDPLQFPAKLEKTPKLRPAPSVPLPKKREAAVLRGLKDLQQLQKQTLAVLEAVKGSLDDINQVLRSPEATRGLEKQKNAATLLAKGFPRDAVEQAAGAVTLLPANPEAHLLLALSLAADQQLDTSLAAARKGLALVDRRSHPLAIEAGLLHTLATLGCTSEAVDRWSAIIDALPLPVLLEQTHCIAACFPATSDAPGNAHLDTLLSTRLAQVPVEKSSARTRSRNRLIDTAPWEIPATALLAGLDAAESATLPQTRKAIVTQVVSRLHAAKDAPDVIRFMTECLVPMANRGLDRTTASLARAVRKRLFRLHADAPTLHRAMQKFQLAGTPALAAELADLLTSWRKIAVRSVRARHALLTGAALFAAGLLLLAFALFANAGPVWSGPVFLALGIAAALYALLGPTWLPAMPENRPPLTLEEMQFLRPQAIRHSLKSARTI